GVEGAAPGLERPPADADPDLSLFGHGPHKAELVRAGNLHQCRLGRAVGEDPTLAKRIFMCWVNRQMCVRHLLRTARARLAYRVGSAGGRALAPTLRDVCGTSFARPNLRPKSAERHRRPLRDLSIGPLASKLDDGFQVPPTGTLGTPLALAGEFGTHLSGGCVGSIPFFGLGSFCFAPTPPGL